MLYGKAQESSQASLRTFFYSYFKNRDIGYAIQIGQAKQYSTSKCLQSTFGVRPPQSFQYLPALSNNQKLRQTLKSFHHLSNNNLKISDLGPKPL